MTFRWTITGLKIIQEDGTAQVLSYGEITIYSVIIGICIGLIIGIILSYISRKQSARLIRSLKELGAETEESALTLSEIAETGRNVARSPLTLGKPLRRYVECANTSEAEKETESGFLKKICKVFSREAPRRTDFNKARFYLPENKRIPAEVRFDTGKMTVATLIISIIAVIGLGIGAIYIMPKLLDMAKSLFGNS